MTSVTVVIWLVPCGRGWPVYCKQMTNDCHGVVANHDHNVHDFVPVPSQKRQVIRRVLNIAIRIEV